jgi:hypothetical protein
MEENTLSRGRQCTRNYGDSGGCGTFHTIHEFGLDSKRRRGQGPRRFGLENSRGSIDCGPYLNICLGVLFILIPVV